MALLVSLPDTKPPRPSRIGQSSIEQPLRPCHLLRLWHLLTLDAPTITGLWAYLLARTAGVHPPPTAMLVLILGTWLVYVSDRLLDARGTADPLTLRRRHYFTMQHWQEFLRAGVVAGAVLAWLIVARLSAQARAADSLVFAVAMVYFAAVHGLRRRRAGLPLPKELAVALLLAAATAVPAWSQMALGGGWSPERSGQSGLVLGTLIFAVVCWLNCMAIERWEKNENSNRTRLPSGFLNSYRLGVASVVAGVVTYLVAVAASLAMVTKQLIPMLISAATSLLLLFLLEWRRDRLTTMQLRIAADLALLTPLIFLPLVK